VVEIIVIIVCAILVLSLGGLGYFTIWRLTTHTQADARYTAVLSNQMTTKFDEVHTIIAGLDKRFRELETEIKMQKNDSSRLTEWLDKRDQHLIRIESQFIEAHKLKERESKIIELGEQLKLITTKK